LLARKLGKNVVRDVALDDKNYFKIAQEAHHKQYNTPVSFIPETKVHAFPAELIQ